MKHFIPVFCLLATLVATPTLADPQPPPSLRYDGPVRPHLGNTIKRDLEVKIEKGGIWVQERRIVDPRNTNEHLESYQLSIDPETRTYKLKALRGTTLVKAPENAQTMTLQPVSLVDPYHRAAVAIRNIVNPNTTAVYTEQGIEWTGSFSRINYKKYYNFPLVLAGPQWRLTGWADLRAWWENHLGQNVPCSGSRAWYDSMGRPTQIKIQVDNRLTICAERYGLFSYYTYVWFSGSYWWMMSYQIHTGKWQW